MNHGWYSMSMHSSLQRLVRFARAATVGFLALAPLASAPAHAQGVAIIYDAEIESMIRRFATPLLDAAGLGHAKPRIHIVNDRRFNAFVDENGDIFVNYGTILEAETPNALKAVLAHEIGHLAGGHLASIREQMENTGRMQAIAMMLGIGALAAAAGAGGGNEIGEMASAFILASQSVGRNSLMAYRRSEENAADAAGLKYLARAGESTTGMVDVLKKLQENQVARAGAASYLGTHPLAEDRLAQVTQAARAFRTWGKKDSTSDIAALALAKAKLVGFLEPQSSVLNRYPNSDKSQAARYARIITAYKRGAAISALQLMPSLVAESPSNPYFNELLGQMYYETGNAAKGLPYLKKAVALASEQTEIRLIYGLALIDAGGAANLNEAVVQLSRVAQQDRESARAWTALARAYSALGEAGEASLAAAEAAMARGDKGTALGLARQAQTQFAQGSSGWLRADDILNLQR